MNFYNISKQLDYPVDHVNHKGSVGAAYMSMYLFDLAVKIQKGTVEQKEKFNELAESYRHMANDLSHVYRLEYTVGQYQIRLEKLLRENIELRQENEILKKMNDEMK